VGGTAASGGYYIATPANAIYAQPVSVTGSIGVVALFPNFAGLSEKAGINWSRILRGEHADFAAPYRELTQDERDRVQQGLQDTYERFVETVADQRSLATDQVRESAEGRIWSGAQAADRKLIDDTGGWFDALGDIRDRFPAADRVELVRVHGQEGFWYGASVTELMRAAVEPELPAGLTELLSTARSVEKLETATPLYLMPYEVNTAR
jgi:protease-4